MPSPDFNLFAYRTYSASADPSTVPFNTYDVFNPDWYWLSYQDTTPGSLAEYYANLLILQYRTKTKAFTTIEETIKPFVMDLLPSEVQDAFNITGTNTAVGVQLDTIGKYVGVTRSGFGFFGPITLDDTDFLTFIRLAIVRNNAGSSLAGIQNLLHQFFENEILVFDYQNMQMSYMINSSIGSEELLQLFITQGLLPRPMGVGLSVVVAPVIDEFFGMRTYQSEASPLVTPLNSYVSYNTDWLFLTYADAI